MSRLSLALCLAGLATAATARAQTGDVVDQVNKDLDTIRHAQRTEDVEVLRRILNHSLGMPNKVAVQPQSYKPNPLTHLHFNQWQAVFPHPVDQYGRAVTNTQQFLDTFAVPYQTTAAYGPFDGVYLAGQGVVYTLHIPENIALTLDPPLRSAALADTCRKCHDSVSKGVLDGAATADVPLSEWDRTRQELLGQPAAEKPAGPARLTRDQICVPGNLAELILAPLARNANHVRHLAKGEKFTVVVTFDGLAGTVLDRQMFSPQPGFTPTPLTSKPAEPRGVPDRPGFSVEESQQLTLGDLHLKQNKPKDAVAAYRRGLARFKEPVVPIARPTNMTPLQMGEMAAELQKGIRDAYGKLAQAQIAAGDIEGAQTALDLARRFKIELVSGAAGAGPKPAIAIPAKLIVTLAKNDLDQAGDDPAAVKKAAKVETVGFPPAKTK